MTDLFMIDLASINLTDGKAFDGMAFGSFVDMHGREVELKRDDAEDFVTNTAAAIEATRGESGELAGLPIDSRNHDKGDAAGWIIGVELVGDIIRFVPKWTKLGIELISTGLQRFFSPTVNRDDKVVLGGSLTNWIASTDETGKVLLRPIELSKQIQAFELEESLDDQASKIRMAWNDQFNRRADEVWAWDVFDDYVIIQDGGTHYRVDYTTTDDLIEFADRTEWVKVKREWIEAMGAKGQQLNLFKNGGIESPDKDSDNGDKNIMLEMTQEQLDAKIAEAIAASQPEDKPTGETIELSQLAELMGVNIDTAADNQVDQFKQLAELAQQQAEMKFKKQLADLQRSNRYAELSARVTGGTPEAPRGVPMDADTIKAELMKLTPEQATFWGGLLESTVRGGLTEFNELGHNKQVKQLNEVPVDYRAELARVMKAGVAPQEFFDTTGLGDASDYDLSDYEGDKK